MVTVVDYFWQGYHQGKWWSAGYVLSMTPVLILIPLFVWVAFVPRIFEFSETRLTIRFWFRSRYDLSWQDLKNWGNGGHSTFNLQFNSLPAFQIALFSYESKDRHMIMDFLAKHFPDRKAKGWIGVRGYR